MRAKHALLCGLLTLVACRAPAAEIDPRGPIAYPGMKVLVDGQGVQTPGYTFRNDCPKPTPWTAKWIGLEKPGVVTLFRKEFTLAQPPQQARAWLTADSKYRLYVNGRLAARGPVDIGRDFAGGKTHRWFYDARDLAPLLVQGQNVIAAEVFRNMPGAESRGTSGLLVEAEITLAGGEKQTLASDATWRALPAPQFPNVRTYDAAKEPAGWRQAGFDDSAWSPCGVLHDVWESLVPSEIPPLMEARYPVLRIEDLPQRTLTADATFRVVFDRVLSAYPTLQVRGGKGATITIHAHREAQIILGEGLQAFEFPFLTEIAPAFTVEVKHVTQPLEIVEVGANFTSQPVAYRGAFASSDERLNRLWNVSRWAVQICLQTHHLDSPNHQEPISDPGDYVIESMVNHYAFAQPWLARQDLRKFAWLLKDENYRNFHTSYSIAWLQMLMDYYDYTGDRRLVEELAPYVHELMDAYAAWRGRNGILSEAPNYMFMDWVTIGGFACHHPPAVIGQGYLTALYYHGMDMAARVAELTGDAGRVGRYAELRRELAAAFNRELWMADPGLYRDGKPFQTAVKPYHWLPADKDIQTTSPHVNLLAVLYDLAPAERRAAIVDKVLAEKPLNTQPWFMHWVFPAIDHAGLFDKYGTPQLRRWQIVPETQSFHEMWRGGDLSHGWCSTPLVQLSARVLGVTPTAPGFQTMAICPQLVDLTWAKGSVPTPHGDVVVSWTLGPDRFQLDVTIPDGTTADVTLPVSRFEQPAMRCDGRPSGPSTRVAAGAHRFELTGKLRPAITVPDEEPQVAADDPAKDLEADVVKDDLLHRYLAKYEDHCTHAGGGKDAGALFNGTTRNGAGGKATRDDGKTFRGYASGDWLEMRLKRPCDVRELRTFSGHSDERATQHYRVLLAYAAAPDKFVDVARGDKPCDGGASELRVALQADRVIAVRLEFAAGPHGFCVYREINLLGNASPAPDKAGGAR